MTKIVKSISLDAQTAPMANEKENFSRWVREQLLSEIQYTQPCVYFEVRHTDRFGKVIFDPDPENPKNKKMRVTKEICNGQKKPTCSKCYPEGPPEREDWLLKNHHIPRSLAPVTDPPSCASDPIARAQTIPTLSPLSLK